MPGFDPLAVAAKKFRLTPREIAVLKLLATGAGWKTIADNLQISISTVAFHSRNITRKTLCPNCFAAFSKIAAQPA